MEIRDLSKLIQKNSEKFAELMSVTKSLLNNSEEANEVKKYLNDRIPNTVKGFNFGYFPKNNELKLIEQYFPLQDLESLGLVYKKTFHSSGYPEEKYVSTMNDHNLIMPYKNNYGDIIGIVGRTLLSSEEQKLKKISKYKNSSILKSMNLFGLYEAKKEIIDKDCVFVVEGQIDCITCHRFGIKNVVALGGATFTGYHISLLKRYTNNIILLLDNDEAGKKSKEKILKRFGSIANLNIKDLPDGIKDIDEYLKKDGSLSIFK